MPEGIQKYVLKQMQDEYVKKSKYKNIKTDVNGIKFASKKEANRFDELLIQQKQGLIRDLKLQPSFTLQESYVTTDGKRVRAIRYVADFSYMRLIGVNEWEYVVEDVKCKATKTAIYGVKRKLMQQVYGIDIQEV